MTIRPKIRRWARQTYRALRHPRHRKGSGLRPWLSRRVFAKELWQPDQKGLAGGVAAGVFVSVFPVIGQSVLAVLLCILARVNIPVSVLATWVGNPVTWFAMAPYQYRIGQGVLEFVLGWELPDLILEGQRFPRFVMFTQLQAWLLGTLVTGVVLALLGYAIAYLLWPVLRRPVMTGVEKVRNVTQRIPLPDLRRPFRKEGGGAKGESPLRTARLPVPVAPQPSAPESSTSGRGGSRRDDDRAGGRDHASDSSDEARVGELSAVEAGEDSGPVPDSPMTPPPNGAPRRNPTET